MTKQFLLWLLVSSIIVICAAVIDFKLNLVMYVNYYPVGILSIWAAIGCIVWLINKEN